MLSAVLAVNNGTQRETHQSLFSQLKPRFLMWRFFYFFLLYFSNVNM